MEQHLPKEPEVEDAAETHAGNDLESLQRSARYIVTEVEKRWLYAPGDTFRCKNPEQHDDPAAWRRVWFMQKDGYLLVGRSFDTYSEVGSFPGVGVEGTPHRIKVVKAVGTPVPGDPSTWIAAQLSDLFDGAKNQPQYCEVIRD